MSLWFNNQLAVSSVVYTGALMSLAMSFVSAAYVVVQATEATTAYTGKFVEGYYFRYAGGSILSNNLGYYEVAAFILYAIWSFGLTAFALYQTGKLLDML
jgi:hypothetical protein